MKKNILLIIYLLALGVFPAGCRSAGETPPVAVNPLPKTNANVSVQKAQTPKYPDLQKEILDGKNSAVNAPIGKFDFGNYNYPLPHGWQDKDGTEAALENGTRQMSEERIGLSLVTVKYQDVTGDDVPEAIVVVKIETGGAAIPQIVYIFEWQNDAPQLIWYFRTGDRADGGLKNFDTANGELVIELYGQDRYIFGAVETMKIVGDKEDLCCPTDFTRTDYKWNGKTFQMQGNRHTFSLADKNAPPLENLNDLRNEENRRK